MDSSGYIKVVRFQNDLEDVSFGKNKNDDLLGPKTIPRSKSVSSGSSGLLKGKLDGQEVYKKPLRQRGLSRIFSEDYQRIHNRILDPRGRFVQQWNRIFLVACLLSLFIDPLFFYLPVVSDDMCIRIQRSLGICVTIMRSVTDVFYLIHIMIQFRTAFIAPSSRVFGRGELVIDPEKIAYRYLRKDFYVHIFAAMPLPQVVFWLIIPGQIRSTAVETKNILQFIAIFQYLPRLFMIYPLTSQIVKETGVVTETAWAGAAYNLLLFMLASHVLGSCWYLLAIERQDSCWRKICEDEKPLCQAHYFDCTNFGMEIDHRRSRWITRSNVTNLCGYNDQAFQFGIYRNAVETGITSAPFLPKYFYCLWWGLQNLSSLGQNLATSTYVGEICFAILIAILGLVLFALLIGNMQTYLQSLTIKLEQWRIKRTDTEEWMQHRQLPQELRERVRRYNQYKWVTTRGVDEEFLLRSLPLDLCRDIKRHLCLDLVRRVPLFDQMDDRLLDAICERLKPALSTQGTYLVREGDPVNEMLFIIRGKLDSWTTNGGQIGFYNSSMIGTGDFCGEELLTWALDPRRGVNLPSSTRTVRALVEVEAFALRAHDLRFVAGQFRRMHSKKLQNTFRFYSHHWRTWAALFIQAAWRRFLRRRRRSRAHYHSLSASSSSCSLLAAHHHVIDSCDSSTPGSPMDGPPGIGATLLASRFVARNNAHAQKKRVVGTQGGRHGHNRSSVDDVIPPFAKPTEPNFEDCPSDDE